MPAERFFFLPLSRRTMGSGHMRRCLDIARRLPGRSVILIDDTPSDTRFPDEWAELIPGFPGAVPVLLTSEALSGDTLSDTLMVFDRRSSEKADLIPWTYKTTPVLLDDNGPARHLAPFLLDTIPGPRGSEANEASPSWLNLPPRRRSPDPAGPILVSFGGDDPSGLTIPLITALVNRIGMDSRRISVTLPAGTSPESLPEGVRVLKIPDGLKDHLADYGLVICSYGLTAWEAVAAGCGVLTADPTDYHARLSREAGFPGIGLVKLEFRRSIPRIPPIPGRKLKVLKRLLNSPENLIGATEKLSVRLGKSEEEKTVASLLVSLEAPRPRCAACGEPLPPVIARFPRRSYYRCGECGLTGLYRFQLRDDEYGPAYFRKEYRDQYGRSYLEDFQAIKAMAVPRLEAISLRAKSGGSLLDIGCAFGPFLDAAREAGYRPHGTDVSEEGTAYVRESLGIPAVSGRFPDDNPAAAFNVEGFDIVSLWYVIEHFANLKTVLENLNGLLPEGGVLALSTPNGAGISAHRSYRRFLENSPPDHYTVWTPRIARRLLARYGFRVYKIRITGQ